MTGKFKYQSKKLLKPRNEEIILNDNQKYFYCCRGQEGMDDWVAVREGARATASSSKSQVSVGVSMVARRATDTVEVQQSRRNNIQ